MHPAKIQISLRIRAVWSEYSLGAFWIAKDTNFILADNEDSGLRLRWSHILRGMFSHVAAQIIIGGWSGNWSLLINLPSQIFFLAFYVYLYIKHIWLQCNKKCVIVCDTWWRQSFKVTSICCEKNKLFPIKMPYHHENMPKYNFDPLKPLFYVVKLGFTGVYINFLISVQNIDCGYSLEPPRRGGSNEYPQPMFWAEIWKISEFFIWKFSVFGVEIFYMFE